MIHRNAFLIQLTVCLVASAIPTVIMVWLTDRPTPLATLAWLVFFLSLQTSFLLEAARTGRLDGCTRWLLHR